MILPLIDTILFPIGGMAEMPNNRWESVRARRDHKNGVLKVITATSKTELPINEEYIKARKGFGLTKEVVHLRKVGEDYHFINYDYNSSKFTEDDVSTHFRFKRESLERAAKKTEVQVKKLKEYLPLLAMGAFCLMIGLGGMLFFKGYAANAAPPAADKLVCQCLFNGTLGYISGTPLPPI